MVATAWVMLEPIGDRTDAEGDPILMRGDNMASVSWVTRCGGARDKRACLLMRMLGRLEIVGGWNHTAKRSPGVHSSLADGISRWPRLLWADKKSESSLTPVVGMNQPLERGGRGFLYCAPDK